MPDGLTGTVYVPLSVICEDGDVRLEVDGKIVAVERRGEPYLRLPDVRGGLHHIELCW